MFKIYSFTEMSLLACFRYRFLLACIASAKYGLCSQLRCPLPNSKEVSDLTKSVSSKEQEEIKFMVETDVLVRNVGGNEGWN